MRYYIAAAACVPVGAALGAWLARGLDDERHGAVLVAHSMVMVLGWIGLTVTGTLVTLWPTMLRTRMDDRAERLARQALPVLLSGLAVLASGAALGSRPVALLGLGCYVVGLAWWGRALVAPARKAPPKVFATWSVTAALGWWVVAIALVGWRLATSGSWAALADGYGVVAAVVAVGFAAQLLFGALSHLIPSVLGGGPSVVRAASAWLDRAALWRVTVVNLGLLICLLPSPSAVRVAVSVLVLGALVAFLPLAPACDPSSRLRTPGAAGGGGRGGRARWSAQAPRPSMHPRVQQGRPAAHRRRERRRRRQPRGRRRPGGSGAGAAGRRGPGRRGRLRDASRGAIWPHDAGARRGARHDLRPRLPHRPLR